MNRAAGSASRSGSAGWLREFAIRTALLVTVLVSGPVLSETAAPRPPPAGSLPLQLEIPPGPLQSALDALAATAHLQILYDPALVKGRSAPGLADRVSPAEALRRLLANQSDIAFEFTAFDAVALFRKPGFAAGPLQPEPPRLDARPLQPATVTVTTDRLREGSYSFGATTSSLKMDGSGMTAPVLSESLTQQLLLDSQAQRLEDVLEYVSAVETAPNGRSSPGFSIRGFPTYQYYVDGVRVSPDLHHDAFRDFANIERIDIVKGPASTLYGRTEPGGLINVVTKQPLADPYAAVEQLIGEFRLRRTELDLGGPLWSDALLSRFNVAYESGDSYRHSGAHRRIFVAPVVTWQLSPKAAITAYAEYLRSDDPSDSGLPVIGRELPPVPASLTLSSGGMVQALDRRLGLRASYRFDDGWNVTFRFDNRVINTPQSPQLQLADNGLPAQPCQPGSCPVGRDAVSVPTSRGHIYYTSLESTRTVSFWRMRHEFLLGLEDFRVRNDGLLLLDTDPSLATDLYAPTHPALPSAMFLPPDLWAQTTTLERWSSLYLQDRIALTRTLSVVLGIRQDWLWEQIHQIVSAQVNSGFVSSFTDTLISDSTAKGRVALLWHPTESFSAYASFLQSVGVQAGIYPVDLHGNSELMGLVAAQEFEMGAKVLWAGGRFSTSFGLFDIQKTSSDLPVLDPALDTQGARLQSPNGPVRNRGVDVDLQARIGQSWQLLGSYAYIDSRITEQFAWGRDWRRMFGVPRHGGSLWLTYRPGMLGLHGLKIGLGAVARSARDGDNANDYELPGFVKWNALAGYGWSSGGAHFNIQLNVDNLLNARYFESLNGTRNVMPGVPRKWTVSLRAQF